MQPQPEEEYPELAPVTLGDLLYADTAKSAVQEDDWLHLVHAMAAGDQLALHALYERTHRLVFTLIMRITGNSETAEELTLDVFHDAWRRARGYDPRNGTVLGWIMNQARSRAIDRLRFEHRRKRTDADAGTGAPDEAAAPAQDAVEFTEQCERLQRAVRQLCPAEREAIETAFFAGLTYAEVAIRLNLPLGTVKTRIRSALQKLRQALAAEGTPR